LYNVKRKRVCQGGFPENTTCLPSAPGKKCCERLKIIIVIFAVFSTISLSCGNEKKEEALPWKQLSESERKAFMAPVNLMLELLDNDTDPEVNGKKPHPRTPEVANPDAVLRAIDAYNRLDGYQMDTGFRTFYRESTYLMYFQTTLAREYDILGECEEAAGAYREFARVSRSDRLIIAYPSPPPANLIYPGDEGYEEMRKETTKEMFEKMRRVFRNCKLFKMRKEWIDDYYRNVNMAREKPGR